MSSQLNVDTIVDKAGSGGTNVKIAIRAVMCLKIALPHKCCARNSKVLGKHNDGRINDSYNVGSTTDTGTGEYFFLINNKANTNYSLLVVDKLALYQVVVNLTWFHNVQVGSTNGYQIQHFQNGASGAPFHDCNGITSHGDLA